VVTTNHINYACISRHANNIIEKFDSS
jgi:hypothetical protein